MKNLIRYLTLGLFAAAVVVQAADTKAYELRIYKTNPGKLEDLLARFRNHTCKIFERHGMENIGYWVPLDDDKGAQDTLIYVIAHKDREAAKASWAAFRKDADWQAASEKNPRRTGKILAQRPSPLFMTATGLLVAVKPMAGSAPRVFELRDYTTPEGKIAPLDARFRDHTVALFEKHGIRNVAYWHPVDADKGAGSRLIYIVAHASKEDGLASFKKFGADPAWQAALKASVDKAGGSLTVKGGVKSTYMRAVDFSPMK
ncbi:MAG: NIPSNAP family protein [Verrucomicrobiae bacterium]|nr:NIPSNAP family protein [Verrucomicrobiae bacterium]